MAVDKKKLKAAKRDVIQQLLGKQNVRGVRIPGSGPAPKAPIAPSDGGSGKDLSGTMSDPSGRRVPAYSGGTPSALTKLRQMQGGTTDADGARAMGAGDLAGDEMRYSHQLAMLDDPYKAQGVPLAPSREVDVAQLVTDDAMHPADALAIRKSVEHSKNWSVDDPVAVATVATGCPVHDGFDISKAQNLWNPMQACICSGKPKAYG